MPNQRGAIWARNLKAYKNYVTESDNDPEMTGLTSTQHARLRNAKTFDSLFEAMGESGWSKHDIPIHAEEHEAEGNISLANTLRQAMASGIRRQTGYYHMDS